MTMKKLLAGAFCALALCNSSLEAQTKPIKFGVHTAPTISFMGSNERRVVPAGANVGINVGVEMEFYFNQKDNYALTGGVAFLSGVGGRLRYEYANGGVLLPNSELDQLSFQAQINGQTENLPGVGDNAYLTPNTTVRYRTNYLAVPLGLKLRTNELGSSFFRAFFHIPIITPMFAISARGSINAPGPNDGGGLDDVQAFADSEFTGPFHGESTRENIYRDVFPLQVTLGLGAGVEFSPQEEGGLRLIGGIYYESGLIDVTKRHGPAVLISERQQNPRTGFHLISLRLGVIF